MTKSSHFGWLEKLPSMARRNVFPMTKCKRDGLEDSRVLSRVLMSPSSKQPYVNEKSNDSKEEEQPHSPTYARLLCHPQHSVHRSS